MIAIFIEAWLMRGLLRVL